MPFVFQVAWTLIAIVCGGSIGLAAYLLDKDEPSRKAPAELPVDASCVEIEPLEGEGMFDWIMKEWDLF